MATRHAGFICTITRIYNEILQNPERIKDIPNLYKFRAVFIPKKEKGYRPIAIQETLLLVFHKILTQRLRNQTKLNKNQMAFQKAAHTWCLLKVEQMRAKGKTLI